MRRESTPCGSDTRESKTRATKVREDADLGSVEVCYRSFERLRLPAIVTVHEARIRSRDAAYSTTR